MAISAGVRLPICKPTGPCSVEIGGITFIQATRYIHAVLPDVPRSSVGALFRIVFVTVDVAEATEVVIEATVERMSWKFWSLASKSPFANTGGGIARSFYDCGEVVIVLENFVELVVPDGCMALMKAGEQRRPSRRAHRRRTVMMGKGRSLGSESVKVRSLVPWLRPISRILPLVLMKYPDVAVAQIVSQDENNVGLWGG